MSFMTAGHSSGDCAEVRVVAFYLPQFHPIPENDSWWGKGFTEWTNVTKAQPLFEGHYQPHLPADLGFYDLRLREVRREQIALAKSYGIDGFCYHYYWFSGKRLLERPLEDMLADRDGDMPFCLCWANENWTRRWDAAEHKVLIAQRYLPEDDLAFIEDISRYLRDPRYIRVDGAALIVVYRPQQLPDSLRITTVWRDYCRKAGIGEIHLCAAMTHGNGDFPLGFDSAVDFPPHNLSIQSSGASYNFFRPFSGVVLDFIDVAKAFLARPALAPLHYRTVFPSWDNTARVGARAVIVANTCPDNYERWLAQSIRLAQDELPESHRLVFVNAWNEWAEGCHLEPDRRYGHAFLEATRTARDGKSRVADFVVAEMPDSALVKRRLASDLVSLFRYHSARWFAGAVMLLKRYPRVRRLVRRLFGKDR